MKIFVVPNYVKDETSEILSKLLAVCLKYNVETVVMSKEDSDLTFGHGANVDYLATDIHENYTQSFKECEVIVSIGGDGTIMHCAKLAAVHNKLVFGINAGKLGFLAYVESDNIDSAIKSLSNKEYTVEYRSAIEADIENKQDGNVEFALNDVVVTKTDQHNIVVMETRCDGHFIDDYRADGLIFSTPTGSTAYNLSAGGPIIDPYLSVVTMVPLNPHSINTKPLVFGQERNITVVSVEYPLYIYADGNRIATVLPNTKVTIKKSPLKAGFINFDGVEFFQVLTKKIKQRG